MNEARARLRRGPVDLTLLSCTPAPARPGNMIGVDAGGEVGRASIDERASHAQTLEIHGIVTVVNDMVARREHAAAD